MEPVFRPHVQSLTPVTLKQADVDTLPESDRARVAENQPLLVAYEFVQRVEGKDYSGFYVRARAAPKDSPVVIYNRGGTADFSYVTHDRLFSSAIADLARAGFVVYGTQCMGTGEHGGVDELGGADYAAVLALKELIDADSYADQTRIGVFGGSRGGMTTYRMLKDVDWVRAAVVISGMADLPGDRTFRPKMIEHFERTFGGTEEGMRERSVLYWVDALPTNVPLLLMNGTSDWRVDPRTACKLSLAFLERRIPHRFIMFEGADHHLSEYRTEAVTQALAWLDRFVMRGEPLPDMAPHGK